MQLNKVGSPLALAAAAIIAVCVVTMFAILGIDKLESVHRSFGPGASTHLTATVVPYVIAAIGGALALLVLDALQTGQLFWGRGTGASDRKRGPIGYWLGIAFQTAMAINLIVLGIGMKLNLIH